jgi:CheY-like chemotaxis protein
MTNPLPEDDAAHLLVVDDDTRIRDLLSRYLTEQGFRVTTAAEAGEARRKLEGLDFDLLIIDVMMPGESGLSLTRSLREIKTVPILMLTALAEGEARIDGLRGRRRRLSCQAVQSARAGAQDQQYPQARRPARRSQDRTGGVRPLHIRHRPP